MSNLRRWILAGLVPALALAAACSSNGDLGDADCDYLIRAGTSSVGTGLPDTTLQCSNTALSLSFTVSVAFLGPTEEEGGLGEPPEATPLSDFLLAHYDVTYRNVTNGGGTVQGVDVPRPLRVTVGSLFDLEETEDLEMTNWPILAASAKVEAPLNDPAFYTSPSGTVFDATITFWGHPAVNDDNWCYATLHWTVTVVPC